MSLTRCAAHHPLGATCGRRQTATFMSARTKPTDACCGSSRRADGAIRQCLLASEIQKHLVWVGRDMVAKVTNVDGRRIEFSVRATDGNPKMEWAHTNA